MSDVLYWVSIILSVVAMAYIWWGTYRAKKLLERAQEHEKNARKVLERAEAVAEKWGYR